MFSVSVMRCQAHPNVQIAALCCHRVARVAHCKTKLLFDVYRSETGKGGLGMGSGLGAGGWLLSSSACGEGTALEAHPAPAAETGYCCKAPCWEFPEASY